MAILFGLLTAVAFGASDFAAGLGGRSIGAGRVALVVQVVALGLALVGAYFFPGDGPTTSALFWGLMAGLGAAGGPLMLYRGMAVGQMSVVAPLSALIAALVPAVVGLTLGEQLSPLGYAGLALAIPAIGLVSYRRLPAENCGKTGVMEGLASGAGFALLFIGLDRAGDNTGAWPLVFGLAFACLIVMPFAWHERIHPPVRASVWLLVAVAAVSDGFGNLLFLAATRLGELSIVAVLTALYPAVTLMLARFVLGERWNMAQWVGLLIAAVAVPFIALK